MKDAPKTLTSALAFTALCLTTSGMATENEYTRIATRNVFGLRPTPEAPVATHQPTTLPRIILTGITDILGEKCVLLKLQKPTQPPEVAREESLMVSEGKRQGDLEVLHIDLQKGEVQVLISGMELTLTMDRDAAKLSVTPPPRPKVGDSVPMPPLPPGLELNGRPTQ